MVAMEMRGVEREKAEIETLKKVVLFRPHFVLSGIGREKWHVLKKPRNCEICGKSVKRGFARFFCFEVSGITYVANEADHARCARKLTKVLMDFRRGGREGGAE